ncbi:glycerophosphodiester phosphodiesterase family protein [Paenibacillus nasutitermitis]|uniref:GP-PDE domain-containing protein n=1 Tax=Paenibacillus nasutitermitis TaxID=1652958 RepID=A0A916Z8S4_9BACL|nr:glycerophosphodiester phosphodiesterase family protein [Paenibacillus nasutitermitis]GGD81885.1 hypothetical protein GCM10010911_45000 [Paenibacillus nasutitermitis]
MIEHDMNKSAVLVAGHRGYASAYPENTLLSFQQAMENGVDMLEFDLRLSADQVVMVIHDETVDRTTNGTGKIADYTAAELQRLDAGSWFGTPFKGLQIPTLSELCELIKPYPNILLNVEIKPAPDAKEVTDKAIDMLTSYGYLERCVFTSFDAAIVAYIFDQKGLRTQGFPAELMQNFVQGEHGTYSKMWAVGISMKLLKPELVKEFQDRGIHAWSYCPDVEQQVHDSLDCGVTLMTCNNPLPAIGLCRHRARLDDQEGLNI